MRGLKDKVIIVTGGAQGIGKSTAERLSEEGATVVVADRNIEGAQQVAKSLEANGTKAMAVLLDVAERESWNQCVSTVVETLGTIDGLVNNAGVTRDRSLLKMTDDEWNTVIDIHLRGAWLGCQTVIPHMAKKGGSIVNISSDARWGAFGQSNYSAAKSGLVGLTRTIVIEQSRNNVRVNAVAPGPVLTPMVEAVPEEVRRSWLANIPLKREAKPEEVASVIAFLLSDDASYVTGQVVGINGGSAI